MTNRLEEIFDHQLELMEKFHVIERENGFHRPDIIGLNLDHPVNQDRLRGLAWHCIEEYGEALDAEPEHRLEELADTMHFLVELILTSGMRSHHFGDSREEQLAQLMLKGVEENWPSLGPNELPILQLSFVAALGSAMNTLKNRPWKQTRRETDLGVYYARLRVALVEFLTVVCYMGYNAEQLHHAYVRKNAENHSRVGAGV